ncbi:MFS transporter [Priestia megaterium]|jgi:MFS family permease|uniref:MFS transporter n=1 Tax=Priestia megaterium TaxID=1404 RepID=UPI001C237570|nr:MFS transporter [Priestia megaterium]MBU8690793.1 MFS transporter [Priestia megaterium]MDQ0808196.1 MFS family permease [Priestia megaterium]
MNNKFKDLQIGTEETLRYISVEGLILLIPIIGIKVLELNNSLIGLAISLSSIGYLLFGYIAGLIADKWNRQQVIITSLLVKSLCFGLFSYLVLSSNLNKLSYFFIICMISLFLVIIETTITAWIPDIYTSENLSGINGVIQFSKSGANLIGPFLGGLSIEKLGISWTLLLIATCLIISSLSILKVGKYGKPKNINPENRYLTKTDKKIKRLENVKYIFTNNVLRNLVLTTGTINFAISIYTAMVVIFLVGTLGLSTYLTGLVISLSGIGALLGSFISPRLIKKFGVIKIMVFGPIIPSFGLLLASFAHEKMGVVLFIIGSICFFTARSIGSVARVTVQQMVVPSHIRGEVSGTMIMLTWGTIPLGALCAGVLSDVIGVQQVLMLAGIILILSNCWLLNRRILNLDDKRLNDRVVS